MEGVTRSNTMKPTIGQKLNNGAVITSVHKQYPSTACTLWLVAAYWDSEPYTPYIVWDYNSDDHGNAFGGTYCDTETKQLEAFNRRKMATV